jgi:hypothetical protein
VRVDVFVQHVLALLFSILIPVILTLQARAGYLYPMPDKNTPFGFMKVTTIFFLLRQMLIFSSETLCRMTPARCS